MSGTYNDVLRERLILFEVLLLLATDIKLVNKF